MPKFEDTFDDVDMECPYCGHKYQPETEDYSESGRVEECESCGKSYRARQSFSVTHEAEPDCELNGQQHDYQAKPLIDGTTSSFCTVCGKCQPLHERV